MIENSDDGKNDHHIVIASYIDEEIIHESMSLAIFLLFTIFFIVQKLNDNLMAKWQATLYPMYLFIIYSFFKFFVKIVKTESSDDSGEKEWKIIKIANIGKVVLISNFFSLINYALAFLMVYNLGEFLDKRKDESLFSFLYMMASICASQIFYSIFRRISMFSIKSKRDDTHSAHNSLAFITSLTTPLLTYFSNMMIVCSGSSGVCTQIYMSTIASLLGAFGVTLSDFSDYLFPITVVLLGVSLFSLYIKRKKLTHKPFLLGVFSSVIILIAHIFEHTAVYYLIYPGNILMIVAAVWNAKLNKFSGLPRFIK
jgi:hypothetical protein